MLRKSPLPVERGEAIFTRLSDIFDTPVILITIDKSAILILENHIERKLWALVCIRKSDYLLIDDQDSFHAVKPKVQEYRPIRSIPLEC